jgi:hypothetical protein
MNQIPTPIVLKWIRESILALQDSPEEYTPTVTLKIEHVLSLLDEVMGARAEKIRNSAPKKKVSTKKQAAKKRKKT